MGLSCEKRRSMTTEVPKRNQGRGALRSGDSVRVFSDTAGAWVDANVVAVEGNFVHVEYDICGTLARKALHLDSDNLDVLSGSIQALMCPLAQYLKNSNQDSFSLHHYLDCGDVIVHLPTGVQIAKKAMYPSFLVDVGQSTRGDHVLYHYCPKEAFDPILQFGQIWASTRLASDCDFGIGIYATSKPPHSFKCRDEILRNNYPRATSKFAPHERGYPAEDRVAYCVPILVDLKWTPSFPLTNPLPNGPCGRILEMSDRYGRFDAVHHDIWLIETKQAEKSWYSERFSHCETEEQRDQLIAFFKATEQGDAEFVDQCLQGQVSVDVSDTHGRSALMAAARAGHEKVVTVLLRAQASVNAANASGRTAVLLAAYGGHIGVVSRLITVAAQVDLGDKNGRTALMWAAKYGHVGVVNMLIAARADAKNVNRWGWTAQAEAEDAGHDSVVRLLVMAEIDVSNDEHVTIPFIHAAQRGWADVVSRCLDNGVSVNAVGGSGWTALHEASHKGHANVAEMLLDGKADTDAVDQKGRTALMWAARSGRVYIGKMLLQAGAQLDITDMHGYTALSWSTWRGNDAMTQMLIRSDTAEMYDKFISAW